MKNVILVLVSVIFILSSCTKDPDDPATPNDPLPEESVLDYYPLAVGNYWVYQHSRCDSTWQNCDSIFTDTTKIIKDTIINNHTYYKLESRLFPGFTDYVYLRDSLDYIVNSKGNIIFSNKDFDNILYEKYGIFNGDTLFYYYAKMEEYPGLVETPAGEFNCLDCKIYIFTQKDNFQLPTHTHHLFAKNVGPVFNQAVYLSNMAGVKWELVDYHLEGR